MSKLRPCPLARDLRALGRENPLDDVTALREVHFVMKDGTVYVEDGTFRWDSPRTMDNPRRKPRRQSPDR